MDFDQQAVCSYGDGGPGKRQNFVALASPVAGIDENRQVAAFLNSRDDGQVQSVAREIGKSSYAALAEHHVVVAFGKDVFGGHQELVESSGHASLQQYRFLCAARVLEQRKILHVARANLDDVGVFFNQNERFVV